MTASRHSGRPAPDRSGWEARALGDGRLTGPLIGLALLVNGGTPVLRAAEPDWSPDELKKLSVPELMQIEVGTVYGASLHEQKTTEAPAAVSIVTAEDIRRQGHRTLADLLNSVRGFYVSYDRGYEHIGVRGFNRPGDYGGRMLLMVDGHRLNDGIFDQAASGTDFLLDVDLIDRVEIIRGPGSSLYGSNAFFGVINVITRRGRDLDGAEVAGSWGTFDTWTGRASLGRRFRNGVEVLLSGSVYDSGGAERLSYPEFVAHDLDGGGSRSLYASAAWRDLTLAGGIVRREKDWPTAAYDTAPDAHDPRLRTIDLRAFTDLRLEHEFENEWTVAGRAGFDRYEYDGDYPYDLDGNPGTPPDLTRDIAAATSAGLDLSVSRQFRERHRLTLGADWRHDFELMQRSWDAATGAVELDSQRTADRAGLFAQDEWTVWRDVTVNGGLRFDHYSFCGQTLNPRAAVIWTPGESSAFKALFGQAIRAPNAFERYYEGGGNRPNPDLDPESIRSWEVVWEQRIGPRWRTSVSAFWNDVTRLIDQQVDPGPDPTSTGDDRLYFDNVGSALARGLELEVEGRLAGGVRTLAGYTFADTEDGGTGQWLANSPRHLGKAALSVPVWRERLFASMELQASGPCATTAGGTTDAFAVANFTLFGRELLPGLGVSLSLHNLFDQHYAHPAPPDFTYTGPLSGSPVRLDAIEQDGRTFRLKFTYRF